MNAIACPVAEGYVRSVNSDDAGAFKALFAEDAVVDDAGREFRGRDAIAAWAESDIFAVQVRLQVVDATESDHDALVTAIVDGDFDRTGLPDPVVIVHRISVRDDKIVRLTCRLAEPSVS